MTEARTYKEKKTERVRKSVKILLMTSKCFYNSKRRHGSSAQILPTEYENQSIHRHGSVWIIGGDSVQRILRVMEFGEKISFFYFSVTLPSELWVYVLSPIFINTFPSMLPLTTNAMLLYTHLLCSPLVSSKQV